MKQLIYKIAMLLVAMLLSLLGLANDQNEINISQINFNHSSTTNIPCNSSTVTSNVTYNPASIPNQADVYVELINDHILNKYDDQLLINSISAGAIEFIIAANTSTSSRTFIVTGNSSTTLTIVQAGATPSGGGSGQTEDDTKFDIQGNWILQRTYTSADSSAWYDDITFYNGLGYPDQIINIGASSNGKNMVTPVVYDSHMRDDSTVFLPYPAAGSQLAREADPISAQRTHYSTLYSSADGARAYSQTLYEASSLERTTGERKSGSTYTSKNNVHSYGTNAANEVLCLKVSYTTAGSVASATLSTSYYPAASLYKTSITNEDGGKSIEFKDKNGNVVLERSLISGSTYADTYYCYDNNGRILWVVTPKGAGSLSSGASYQANHSLASMHSYIYAYDGYGNLTEKRQPGRDAEYYIYDKGNRCVMYQDGNLRDANHWLYTTFDNLNREVEKTIVSTALSRSSLQNLYHNSAFRNKYENLSNPNIPANSTNVTAVKVLYSARYYGYTYNAGNDIPSELNYSATSIVSAIDKALFNNGQLKYEKHLLLSSGTALLYKQTAYYYNSRGELLQTVTKYPNGNILRTSYRYDFTGNIITKEEICNGITKLTAYIYNNRGQLIADSTTLNNGSPASVVYSYDDLGRVTQRTLGNGIVETQEYNIQGWLTQVAAQNGSANIYNQTLRYYNPTKGTAALYSGNISEWASQMGALSMQTYGFTYDLQGRLTQSNRYSGTSTSAQNSYTERGITYDKNGNILTLQRYAAALQDNYTYTYNGNKVASISGTNNGTAISAATYSYDNNGNTTTDGLKNLQITYNILNLPQSVTQSGTTKATYGWFADGSKYSVLDAQGNGYYYIGSLIYSSTAGTTALESTDFSGGRIVMNGSTQKIHYHHKDHLGSIRAVTDTNGTVIEQNAYYPFGGRHTFGQTYAQTTSNRYKFNGKELQTTGNIGLLDYGARMYDTKTARWLVQDPLAEKYYPFSAYNYCVNNPVINIDRDGRDYDVYFFTQKKQILIHAVYYTNKKSESSAKQAVKIYNNFSDLKYYHKGKEYKVTFDLKVKSSSNPEAIVKGIKDKHNLNSYIYGQPSSNNKKSGFVTTGSTTKKNQIVISEKYEQDLTGAHEIGHSLYLTPEDSHSQEGIMKEHEKDPEKDQYITQDNVNHMIDSAKSKWIKIKK